MTLGDNDVFSELFRLRQAIRWIEWGGWVADEEGNMVQGCPWCGAKRKDGKHHNDCTAFKVSGEVK